MNRLMLLIALSLLVFPGCNDDGGNAETSERELIEAYCELFSSCGGEYGLRYVSWELCVDDLVREIKGYQAQAEMMGMSDTIRADAEDATECTQALKSYSCTDLRALFLRSLGSPIPGDSACRRVSMTWYPNYYRSNVPQDLAVGEGAECPEMRCKEGLTCEEIEGVKKCLSWTGRSCSETETCLNTYFCGDQSTCQPRVIGSACSSVEHNECDSAVPDLTCIEGACAARSATGGHCEDRDDCATFGQACIQGACAAGKDRGQACASDDECKGFMSCDGVCRDLPGEGEACTYYCLTPLRCKSKVCTT